MLLSERGRKPALQHRVCYRSYAVPPDRLGARIPCVWRVEAGRGTAQDELFDALWRLARHPHADHPANGEAAEREVFDAEAVHQREHVSSEIVDRVGSGRDRRAAVAAMVVAHDPEALAECWGLSVLHIQRGAKRVRHHEDGRVLGALDPVVQFDGLYRHPLTSLR